MRIRILRTISVITMLSLLCMMLASCGEKHKPAYFLEAGEDNGLERPPVFPAGVVPIITRQTVFPFPFFERQQQQSEAVAELLDHACRHLTIARVVGLERLIQNLRQSVIGLLVQIDPVAARHASDTSDDRGCGEDLIEAHPLDLIFDPVQRELFENRAVE